MMAPFDSSAPHRPAGDFARPPAVVILLYAVQGWAAVNGLPCSGLRRLPARSAWLPHFVRLLHQPDACQTLADHACQGLRADNAPAELAGTVQRAMRRPDALALMVDALAAESIRC